MQAREVCDSASIAAKHVLERSGAEADPVCQGEDGGVIARSCKVVDEGRVLRQERVCCYIECMLEKAALSTCLRSRSISSISHGVASILSVAA